MRSPKLFSSHSLEILISKLAQQIASDGMGLFSKTLILVPSQSAKEWVQRELAKKMNSRAIVGVEVKNWQEGLKKFTGPLPVPTRNELQGAIWVQLNQRFGETHSEKKRLDLTDGLTDLFLERSIFGVKKSSGWVEELWESVCTIHGWKTLPEALQKMKPKREIPFYLFGIDSVPNEVLHFFLRHQNPRIFRFSPCAMFWQDARSSSERKHLLKRSEGMGSAKLEALEALLRDTQPLLSNWGMLGRKQLSVFEDDRIEVFEEYAIEEEKISQLGQLKLDLLLFQNQSGNVTENDGTLSVVSCGISKMEQVRFLREEILKSEIPLDEIRIYAPQIEEYIPLLEFVFQESEQPLPLRVAGKHVSLQSPFYTALDLLFECVTGRWGVDEVVQLLTTPPFCRKMGWTKEGAQKIVRWVQQAKIRGGLNGAHRSEFAKAASSDGTWEQGVDFLIDSWTCLDLEENSSIPWSEAEWFESFLNVFDRLQKRLLSWREAKTLLVWAEEVEKIVAEFFLLEESGEADSLMRTAFSHFIKNLRSASSLIPLELFPHSFVRRQLRVMKGSEGGGFHAIACASLEEGSVLPAKLIFILGMQEEAFPRQGGILLSKELKTGGPSQGERDRYLFLQLLFAAKERLVMTYCDRSEEDGKEVHPSLLIQELCTYVGLVPSPRKLSMVGSPEESQRSPVVLEKLPDCEKRKVIPIQELNSFLRSSIGYYLERIVGIRWREEVTLGWKELEWTPLSQYRGVQATLREEHFSALPVGILGRAAEKKMGLRTGLYKKHFEEWGVAPGSVETLSFKETTVPLNVTLSDGTEIRITGEVPWVVRGGILYFGEDSIQGVLKKWAEILSALTARASTQIFSLATGRIREVQEPGRALGALVELFLRCQKEPLFFDPEWADAVLRHQSLPMLESETDPLRWALRRNLLAVEENLDLWGPLLQTTFSSLISIFPSRSRVEV